MAKSAIRGNVSCTSDIFFDIILDRVEHYDASQHDCYAFRRGTDSRNGFSLALGNMVNGFSFKLHGIEFANSELAYICGCFSEDNPQHKSLQIQLASCTNGLLAKRAIRRPNNHLIREDWESFNIQWMLYVVWNKVISSEAFQKILLALPEDAVIIEDSTFQAGRTAEIWGTRNKSLKANVKGLKKQLNALGMGKGKIKSECDKYRLSTWATEGEFVGKNLMGKILMICARALRNGIEPPIDYTLLHSKRICFFGQTLSFIDKIA